MSQTKKYLHIAFVFILFMFSFVVINQMLFPAMGSGNSFVEGTSLLAIITLIVINIKSIQSLITKFNKKQTNDKL